MNELAFYILAAATIAAAVGVVALPNPVHSALALVVSLLCVAVCFAALEAHLIAALQIIVYAGAVMVLFLFVIMLLNLQTDRGDKVAPRTAALGITAALALAGVFGSVLWQWAGAGVSAGTALPEGFGTTRALALLLFTEHVVAFELTSVLLLVAVVGAVVLARREPGVG